VLVDRARMAGTSITDEAARTVAEAQHPPAPR
jgi:hypothetical protein